MLVVSAVGHQAEVTVTSQSEEDHLFLSGIPRFLCLDHSGMNGIGRLRCREEPLTASKLYSTIENFDLIVSLGFGITVMVKLADQG